MARNIDYQGRASALKLLELANMESVAAELAAARKQEARRAAVRNAFNAGLTAVEIAKVLNVSPQRAYQIRDISLQETA
jgi:DNA-directed RNA polymerase specialized sigma subunit